MKLCLDAQGRFIPAHRRYRELLRVLTNSRSQVLTMMTSPDLICEPGIPLTHYRLPGHNAAARDLAEGIVHRVLSENASGRHAFFACLRTPPPLKPS